MTLRSVLLAVAACAVLGSAAGALEGSYLAPSGTKVTFTADSAHVEIPNGPPAFDVPYVVEGDTFTFNAAPDDPTCPGIVGVYTVVESETGLAFTAVSDECEARKADVTAGAWTKAE